MKVSLSALEVLWNIALIVALTVPIIAPVTDIEPAPSFIEDEPDNIVMPHSPPLTNAPQDVSMKEAESSSSITIQPTTIRLAPKIGMSHDQNVGGGDECEPSVSIKRIWKYFTDLIYIM